MEDQMAVISALQCPSCGAAVRATHASCRSCGVGLSFNYAELLGVSDYSSEGRDVVLDATLLALVDEEADRYGFEVVPALDRDRILVYVRHLQTMVLVPGGMIIKSGGGGCDIWGDSGYWTIHPQIKLGQGGRIYRLCSYYSRIAHRIAEGEEQLGEIPEIREWVNDSIRAAVPEPEPHQMPPAARKFRLTDPTTWVRKSVIQAEKALA